MNGQIPVIAVIVFMALYLFYETNRIIRNRKSNRQEDRRLNHDAYLKSMISKKK